MGVRSIQKQELISGGVIVTNLTSGICPKCGHIVNGVKIEHIIETEVEETLPKWKVISFCCRNCGVVLGVGFDPHEIAELVELRLNARKSS
jgi:predicted RNA-binding Zn-ribbon protein involved in translation (DUF1610 family)